MAGSFQMLTVMLSADDQESQVLFRGMPYETISIDDHVATCRTFASSVQQGQWEVTS